MTRLLFVSLLLLGCRRDVGIPDDWATTPIPLVDVTVVETTCGEHRPEAWTAGGVFIDNQNARPGEPYFDLQFERHTQHLCQTSDVVAPYSFVCDLDNAVKAWVNQEEFDCQGFADVTVSGTFLGPREAVIDLEYDVNDCPCDTSCAPYPAPCVVRLQMTYGDDG